jgi:hypothetical protein
VSRLGAIAPVCPSLKTPFTFNLHRYAEEITNALVRGLEKNGGEVRLKTHVVGLCKLNPAGP